MGDIGKIIVVVGVVIVIIGLLWNTIPFFQLPGDITIKRDNFFFSFPIITSIILSILITLLINFFFRK